MEPSKSANEQRRNRLLHRRAPIRLYQDSADDRREQIRLGEILRARREELGLRHREVAAKADVSTSYIGMVERGERRPTLPNLRAILIALDLPMADHGAQAVEFDYVDDGFLVLFKAMNPMTRWRPGLRPGPAGDPGKAGERLRVEQDRLGALLRLFALNPAATESVYRFVCSGDPEMPDDELPSSDAILGEVAQVLAGSPGLARQVYKQYFGEAAQAFLSP